ncbi:LacI family DNA-binding transcriptional regulator [Hoeflea sp. CAU 1731]
MKAGPSPITSNSVAKAAGVSQSTVSLVMSGKSAGRVSDSTRDHVMAVADRLGYRPNATARMLRTGVLNILALAVPNVKQPFFGEIFVAAEKAARQADHAVVLIDTQNDPKWVERIIDMVRGRMIAGSIVYASDSEDEPRLAEIADQVLVIEGQNSGSPVDINVESGIDAVVEHLAGLGHSGIGYLSAAYPKVTFKRRFDYFRKKLRDLGLEFRNGWHSRATFEIEASTSGAQKLVRQPAITAIVCDDDLLAAGVYRAARQAGRAIPDDLSVVGFNDIEFARVLSPELTTLAIPTERIAQEAVHKLLEKLEDPARVSSSYEAELTLKIRSSTARPGE